MTACLFIGRFSPLHNGHVAALEQAFASSQFATIAIGSSQSSHQKKNPFSFNERTHMLSLALSEMHIPRSRYRIIALPDFFNDEKWAAYVLSFPADEVFSGSAWVRRCLKGKKRVRSPRLLKRAEYRATLIRTRMRERKPWEHLVPSTVAAYLKSIEGPQRVRSLYSRKS